MSQETVPLLTLAEVRQHVGKWSRQNFGDQSKANPLGGIGEEIGELQHAVLKANQKIRGDFSKHMADARDAVGDIFIYMSDYSCRSEYEDDLMVELKVTDKMVFSKLDSPAAMKYMRRLFQNYGSLCWHYDHHGASDTRTKSVWSSLFVSLQEFSLCIMCEDLQQVAHDTWTKIVSKRNWVANAEEGKAPQS